VIAVRVIDKDGTETHYVAVSQPWTFRQFLVIDTGTEHLVYRPLSNIDEFTTTRAA